MHKDVCEFSAGKWLRPPVRARRRLVQDELPGPARHGMLHAGMVEDLQRPLLRALQVAVWVAVLEVPNL
eukprot:CAMPEP_0177347330 /NCGR_PEP_ID=MMETSP0368-20130122/29668_1 /TAXON_ID=447022 ORGANISM="Scrippsiella hangoei-like, Strain SHHI-4" /NCGR_SAMPLE_ID=MMETSP0368 /ASSEMBLY_ACC=CAM_ASM_000363 /LENGTH=68 /DNA_ID=CAMNT_0018809055 /DNA_START=146 /DNA_END=352 /DNA_ORIENTATION=-